MWLSVWSEVQTCIWLSWCHYRSLSSKIQIDFTFLVPAHPGSPGKRAVKRACVYPQDGGESRLTLKLRHSHPVYRIEYRIVDGWAAAAAAAACSVSPTADACKLVVFVMRAPAPRYHFLSSAAQSAVRAAGYRGKTRA